MPTTSKRAASRVGVTGENLVSGRGSGSHLPGYAARHDRRARLPTAAHRRPSALRAHPGARPRGGDVRRRGGRSTSTWPSPSSQVVAQRGRPRDRRGVAGRRHGTSHSGVDHASTPANERVALRRSTVSRNPVAAVAPRPLPRCAQRSAARLLPIDATRTRPATTRSSPSPSSSRRALAARSPAGTSPISRRSSRSRSSSTASSPRSRTPSRSPTSRPATAAGACASPTRCRSRPTSSRSSSASSR